MGGGGGRWEGGEGGRGGEGAGDHEKCDSLVTLSTHPRAPITHRSRAKPMLDESLHICEHKDHEEDENPRHPSQSGVPSEWVPSKPLSAF